MADTPYSDHPLYEMWGIVKGWVDDEHNILLETARCTRDRDHTPAIDLYPKDDIDTDALVDRVEEEFEVKYVKAPNDRLRFVKSKE